MSVSKADNNEFAAELCQKAQLVNDTLRQILCKQVDIDSDLKEAIKYTLEAPGKRLRSALVLWCCQLVAGKVNHNAKIAAAGIEMVHTYSLVHDDLPAMDDDNLRRGLPSCHKAFDEATAILVGDGLLTLAFEILAKEITEPNIAVKLIGQLAQDAGPAGMIAGQTADLKSERRKAKNAKFDEKLLRTIHTNKTAKMFRCASVMGAICGGAKERQLESLCEYGLKIGLGFQIADDILDVCGLSKQLGKSVGKDVKANKLTYPAVVGLERSRQLEIKLADEAVTALEPFDKRADILRRLAMVLPERTM